jgi:hypothetical protein
MAGLPRFGLFMPGSRILLRLGSLFAKFSSERDLEIMKRYDEQAGRAMADHVRTHRA